MPNRRMVFRWRVMLFGVMAATALSVQAYSNKASGHVSVARDSGAKYHVVHGWPVLPENTILDETSAVGVDSHDNVFVLQVMRPDGSLSERIGRYRNYDGQFRDIHWVAFGRNGQIYAADFTGRRVQKFVPEKH